MANFSNIPVKLVKLSHDGKKVLLTIANEEFGWQSVCLNKKKACELASKILEVVEKIKEDKE